MQESIIAALVAAKYTSKEIYQFLDELELEQFVLDERKTILPQAFTKWLCFILEAEVFIKEMY